MLFHHRFQSLTDKTVLDSQPELFVHIVSATGIICQLFLSDCCVDPCPPIQSLELETFTLTLPQIPNKADNTLTLIDSGIGMTKVRWLLADCLLG